MGGPLPLRQDDSDLLLTERLRLALTDGLVVGARWGVTLLVLAVVLSLVLGDYQTTRANAAFAADYIRRVVAEQQRQQAAPPSPK